MTTRAGRPKDPKAPLPSSRPRGPAGRQSKFELVSMIFGEGDEFAQWLIFERSRKPPTPYDVLGRLLWTEHGIDVSYETLKGWCKDLQRQLTVFDANKKERDRAEGAVPAKGPKRRPPYETG